jgi:uncharacterized protein YecA (UPF0149 family)
MDTRTGEVMTEEQKNWILEKHPEDARFYKSVPYQRTKPKTGRNDPCPCMSGKKFKKCCYMTG